MLIEVDGKQLEVFGPYRDGGRVTAISEQQMRDWAASLGARLLTARERDALHAQADVQVRFKARNPVSAPLDAMDDDVQQALGGQDPAGLLISAGKTNINDGSGQATNYGGYVPASEVKWSTKHDAFVWDAPGGGMKVYPTTEKGYYVIQSPGHAHGPQYVDYSHLGYAAREVGAQPPAPPEPPPQPPPLPGPPAPPPAPQPPPTLARRYGWAIVIAIAAAAIAYLSQDTP